MSLGTRTIEVSQVRTTDWVEALELLHSALSDAGNRVLYDLGRLHAQPTLAAGLWGCWRHGQLAGVVWYEAQAGRVAYLHPPVVNALPGANRELIATTLLAAAERIMQDQGNYWLQTLVDLMPQETWTSNQLAQGGFRQLSTLSYQVCTRERFPIIQPTLRWRPEPVRNSTLPRLGQTVIETYRQSLDCPGIDGIRPIEEILAGYRSVGDTDLASWWLAVQNNNALGCLLMARHPEVNSTGQMVHFSELIYWGVVPERRGEGLGQELVSWTLWQAGQMGSNKLVLAVDALNVPALRIYQRLGFWEWNRKAVWAKSLTPG